MSEWVVDLDPDDVEDVMDRHPTRRLVTCGECAEGRGNPRDDRTVGYVWCTVLCKYRRCDWWCASGHARP